MVDVTTRPITPNRMLAPSWTMKYEVEYTFSPSTTKNNNNIASHTPGWFVACSAGAGARTASGVGKSMQAT